MRHFVAGASPGALAIAFGYAEKINAPAGRGVIDFDSGRGHRAVGSIEGETGIDEPGVDGRALQLPDVRVGGRRQIFAHGLDETVANDDSGAVNDFGRFNNDFGADQRVNAGRKRPMAGRKDFRAEHRQRKQREQKRPATASVHGGK